MKIKRKKTKVISVGNVKIGGTEPIRVQSMTKTDTKDIKATVDQIKELFTAGCEIVRVAVKDEESSQAIKEIVKLSPLPIIADIHFNYKLAIKSILSGVQGIRINPGNIGNEDKIREVVKYAKEYSVPIRVGVNAGSLEKDIERKYGGPTPEALVESALRNIEIIEKFGYDSIKVSIKSSEVLTVISSYELLSEKTSYPLHLGVTEAGSIFSGSIKSSVALGILLSKGIGDTIRISLTGSPVKEVEAAYLILSSLGLRQKAGFDIISCPTCGRCEWNLSEVVKEIEEKINNITPNKPIKIAVMGCAVNGPGEAKHADIGIAGGKKEALLFKKGQVIKKIPVDEIVDALLMEILKVDS
ncbi:MAG: flavodoxin-dependent (E)-4-hydroxy-3-methylbut-2-enyl-diphosphate synthase [Clostridia bacterium]|nr:flavodoxin-dependent (E)-4-hydroxy-3-methylbut-2-enyl-diphosphate synthase [Clostridia bacterium]